MPAKKKTTKPRSGGKKTDKKKQAVKPRKEIMMIEEDFLTEEDVIEDVKLVSQLFLFGEADQILNALETQLKEKKDVYEKLDGRMERLVKRMEEVSDMISELRTAIDSTIKHAPKKEDPAVPDPIERKVQDIADKMSNDRLDDEKEEPVTKTEKEEIAELESALEEFRTPDPDVKFTDIVKKGMLIRPSMMIALYAVDDIRGPMRAVSSNITREIVPCPDVYTIHCISPDPATSFKDVYYHNLIIFGGKIRSVFKSYDDTYEIVGKPDKDGTAGGGDPY